MTRKKIEQSIRNHIIAGGTRRSLAAKLEIPEAQIAQVEAATGIAFPGKAAPVKRARFNCNPEALRLALEQLK